MDMIKFDLEQALANSQYRLRDVNNVIYPTEAGKVCDPVCAPLCSVCVKRIIQIWSR